MIRLPIFPVVLAAIVLTACSPFDETAPRTLTATLSVGEAARLPDGTLVLIELVPVGGDDEAVAEASAVLEEADLPLEVSLTVDPARLTEGENYAVRAGLAWDGELRWLSDDVPVDVRRQRINAGEIRLHPFDTSPPAMDAAAAVTSEEAIFLCSDGIVILNRSPEGATLSVEDEDIAMGPAMAGEQEGVLRHESADGQTWFDDAGATARYAVEGEAGPDCVRLY